MLVLGVGRHDADSVDAYHGPPELKGAADEASLSLAEIEASARALIDDIDDAPASADEIDRARPPFLRRQLEIGRAHV